MGRRRAARARVPLLGVAGVLLLAGCAAGATASAPTWVPQPSFSGEGGSPRASVQVPVPAPATPSSGTSAHASSSAGSGPAAPRDPAVVATKLTAPDAIALLPDNTALVGERTTGRIVRVQPLPGMPVTAVRTLAGLDTSGDGGLLDLALSPNYSQDNLVFAYVTTATDNRVVDFTLTGPVTPVLTGIPRGSTDNAGRLAFDSAGRLYVATGDAGRPAAGSLAGAVLRVTDIGTPAPGNPSAGSPVFTSGQHLSAGLCLAGGTLPIAVDAAGQIDALQAGSVYGAPGGNAARPFPLGTLTTAQSDPGGCAVIGSTLFVTSRTARALLSAPLAVQGTSVTLGAFTPTLTGRYGRLATVVAAADGALWMTTSNRDGHGHPVPDDERVLRVVPDGASANYPG